ncbi:hypothetical protein BQ8794_160068 [Mesorhizobium prunaredense]|uniref:Uncharacterized protein n=1 Tax=Mesorhizobium prunaredense TaxID=1631249 RepID=A0A1R3V3I4_9HYPH|nr:hypothetical protein BQ8794_160068 [Mesorhizobium prunaredense]
MVTGSNPVGIASIFKGPFWTQGISDALIGPRPRPEARAFSLVLSATSSRCLVEEIWTLAHRHLAVGSKLVHCVGQFTCEPVQKFLAGQSGLLREIAQRLRIDRFLDLVALNGAIRSCTNPRIDLIARTRIPETLQDVAEPAGGASVFGICRVPAGD